MKHCAITLLCISFLGQHATDPTSTSSPYCGPYLHPFPRFSTARLRPRLTGRAVRPSRLAATRALRLSIRHQCRLILRWAATDTRRVDVQTARPVLRRLYCTPDPSREFSSATCTTVLAAASTAQLDNLQAFDIHQWWLKKSSERGSSRPNQRGAFSQTLQNIFYGKATNRSHGLKSQGHGSHFANLHFWIDLDGIGGSSKWAKLGQ